VVAHSRRLTIRGGIEGNVHAALVAAKTVPSCEVVETVEVTIYWT
jgi:hypothetical protein